jgi:hypothetical protein
MNYIINTIEKRENLIKAGYNYIEIWEHQVKEYLNVCFVL